MGRKKALSDEQVNQIFNSPEASAKELGALLGVSYVTVLKVRKGTGAYKPIPIEGTLVLDDHGNTTLTPIISDVEVA